MQGLPVECATTLLRDTAMQLREAAPKGVELMPFRFFFVALVLLLFGCGPGSLSQTPSTLTAPSGVTANPALDVGSTVNHLMKASGNVIVNLMDACDPQTFNAPPPAGAGPGTCARNGGVTFQNFIEQLMRFGSIGAWHMAPPDPNLLVGQHFLAVNHGGETHTFTEVEEFGGGIVPALNTLANTPVEAPECKALESDDFIAPGATYVSDTEEESGEEKYQCCIHPWMRLTAHIREK
jgi:hypothetical protein